MPAADEQPVLNAAPGGTPDTSAAILSRVILVVAIALLVGTFLLLSPPRGRTYPGAIPWSDFSILRPLTELLSLSGLVATARGTEIKDLALHLAAVAGLGLLALRLWLARSARLRPRRLTEPWFSAQLLLAGWVLLSALSALWAGDAALARGQAALYALALGWAVALAWTLDRRHVPHLLGALVVVSALAAVLCIWYYHERNPHHRPGFPLGNPATLSASLLPAILVSISVLAGAVQKRLRAGRFELGYVVVGAAVALVPLLWCFALTSSRAAMLGLAVGLAATVFLQAGRVVRWAMAGLVLTGLLIVVLGLVNYSRLDAAMARSATIRFRVYAWRYAAELWNQSWQTAIAGQGAGAYPRLAGELSVHDRVLDPAAFMADMVEHSHNELFEVLTEIGLVGGVTFVGGILATLLAGGVLLRRETRPNRRWLHVALLAALVALMTDAMTSPGLRLAGVPAVFYTLVGMLWAASRFAEQPQTADALAALAGAKPGWPGRRPLRRLVAGVLVGILAVGAGWVTVRNWVGVVREEAANYAFARGDFDPAVRDFELAEARLLDPVRQLVNQGRAMHARLWAARGASEAYFAGRASLAVRTDSQPTTAAVNQELLALRQDAIARCESTWAVAGWLSRRAPTLMSSAAVAAAAAEYLTELHRFAEPEQARRWEQRAGRAWRWQRNWRPYDLEALLALTRGRANPLNYRVGCLRDALRSIDGYNHRGVGATFDDWRQWQGYWQAALRRLASEEGFGETLERFLAVVGPVDPETDLDSLIASGAPEVYRLAAHYEALRGNLEAAQRYAARAALLYEPMRARFPTLHSVALLEQAEFALRESPDRADVAAELLRDAIQRLPVIQKQKYEALARPFRRLLAVALLAGGAQDQAAAVLRAAADDETQVTSAMADECVRLAQLDIRRPVDQRPPVDYWLTAALGQRPDHLGAWGWRAWLAAERGDVAAVHTTLADAVGHGLRPDDIQRIRDSLCQEFPALCERIQTAE